MLDIRDLGKILGEEIVNDPGLCLYPGRFKPPHRGHFSVVRDLTSRSYITKIIVLISQKPIDGITAEQSLSIWNQYLQADPNPKVTVKICTTQSPVTDVYKEISSRPEEKVFYIVGGIDESDDENYLEALQKSFGDKVRPLEMQEKAGTITAPYVRDLLRSGDYEKFKTTLPDAALQKGLGPEIFKMLAGDVKKRDIKESFVPDTELKNDIERFNEWCCTVLEIQKIPTITLITDSEFSKNNSSFGGYIPSSNEIVLAIHNRHRVDICRTLAHELIHCKQNETTGINLEDGETGSDVENEANAMAGVIMREYGKRNNEIYR